MGYWTFALTWSSYLMAAPANENWKSPSPNAKQRNTRLDDSRDKVISQVWRYYSDTKLAIRRLEVAATLVEDSQKTYEQTLEAYKNGLSSLVDLLAVRSALSQARYTQLDTRTILSAFNPPRRFLAFASGDLGPLNFPTEIRKFGEPVCIMNHSSNRDAIVLIFQNEGSYRAPYPLPGHFTVVA